MKAADIVTIRLHNQQISTTKHLSLQSVAGYMGAIQAQDFAMARWALGLRFPESTDADVIHALDKGQLLRTHVLRPTWHIVSARDIHWMLALTAPHIRSSMRSRDKELELTPSIYNKSNDILLNLLEGQQHQDRITIADSLNKAGIITNDNRLSHLLAGAELDGLICSGVIKNNRQTYALLDERAPYKKEQSRDISLAKLAQRFFESHGPATLADFTWWSGLPAKDARQAVKDVGNHFIEVRINDTYYWLKADTQIPKGSKNKIHLLPAFDEFIVSYKNRSEVLPLAHHKRAVSVNGIFKPVILRQGKAIGLWKRSLTKDQVVLEAEHFDPEQKTATSSFREAADTFARFLQKDIKIKS